MSYERDEAMKQQEALEEMIRMRDPDKAIKPYKDPTCPKCGIILGNRMMYCCGHTHCPVGLN